MRYPFNKYPQQKFRPHWQQYVMKSWRIQLIHRTINFFSQSQVSNKVRSSKRFQNNRIEAEGGRTLSILPPAASLNRLKGVSDGDARLPSAEREASLLFGVREYRLKFST